MAAVAVASSRRRAFSDLMDSWFDSFHIPKITRRSVALSVRPSVSRVGLDASFLLSSERTDEAVTAAREGAVLLAALISLARARCQANIEVWRGGNKC